MADGGGTMADGVSVEQDGQWVVRLNGIKYYSAASFFEASAFSTGFKLGLESRVSIGKESDVVADTVRALDEERDEPPLPFKVGDRVEDFEGDVGTVVEVDEGAVLVRYDDRSLGADGLVSYDSGTIHAAELAVLPAAGPSVTPHPDRPETADGELPDGWREDCFGTAYSPDGSFVGYSRAARDGGFWVVSRAGNRGPYRFTLRSEAIARLGELLAEGGSQ